MKQKIQKTAESIYPLPNFEKEVIVEFVPVK